MEKIYSEQRNLRRIVKAKPETIKFLMAYSRSLNITAYKGLQFEAHLN